MLDSKAVARTVVSTIGAGVAGVFSANPVAAPAAFTALSSALNELLGDGQTPQPLAAGLQAAVDQLARDIESAGEEFADQVWALNLCGEVFAEAAPETLKRALVEPEAVSALLAARRLSDADRAVLERWLRLSLAAWQAQIAQDEPLVDALREAMMAQLKRVDAHEQQLAAQQNKLNALALQGIKLPQRKRYTATMAPSRLFRPEYRVLPLLGRQVELATLRDWCEDEAGFGLRAMVAPGGMGKTRLAAELMDQCLASGWLAGWVTGADRLNTLPHAELPPRILLVLDYADYQQHALKGIKATAEELVERGHRVRVLCLARPDEAWWHGAVTTFEEAFSKKTFQFSALGRPVLDHAHANTVLHLIAAAAGVTPPEAEFTPPANATPLMWMMAAYRQLMAPDQETPDNTDTLQLELLCRQIVDKHERSYIDNKLIEARLEKRYTDAAMQTLALITLAGGLRDANACAALMQCVPALAAEHEQANRDDLLKIIKTVYPDRTGIDALRPDLLGEYLCATQLSDELLNAFIDWVLAMIAAHKNDNRDHIEWLLHLAHAEQLHHRTEQWPDSTAPAGLANRWQTALRELPLEKIGALASTDDSGHLQLRELNALLCQLHLDAAGDDPEPRAHALNNLANHLSDLGQREPALQAAQEAVDIRHQLADERPQAFRPDLAMSLGTICQRYRDSGYCKKSCDAGLEAAGLFAEQWRDYPQAFEQYLGMAIRETIASFEAAGETQEAAVDALLGIPAVREFLESQLG